MMTLPRGTRPSRRQGLHSIATLWGTALAVLLLLTNSAAPANADSAERPNIVLMMADDMGYSDIGCYGGEINTPNLNKLAANGLRFTQFYNTARCCPTRASLMTGLYPHQAGVGHMMNDRGLEGYQGDLNEHCLTIAQVLQRAGYGTYMSGKWHVTEKTRPKSKKEKHNWPRQRGFDRFFGTIHGAGSFYDPNSLTRNNKLIPPPSEDFFYTDAISDNAATFITEHDASKPFFLYVAYTAPHWPMHARPHNIAKYQGVYDAGWDAIRKARYERMVEMGLIRDRWDLSGRDPRVPPWEDAKLKEWQIRCMEVYAAMVDCMDQGIGRIVDALERTDQLDNTLVLFLADNGGCAEAMGRRGKFTPRPTDKSQLKPMDPDELQYRMIPKYTRAGYPVRQGRGVMPGPADTYIGYGRPWANVSNTPFREYKHWVHEGGISTPLIAHWPAGIGRAGEFERQPGHLIDILATCLDLAGAEYPKKHAGHALRPLQGKSLVPAFEGEKIERDALYWEHEGNRAVRVGRWKLVAKGARGDWELYDLHADRSETNNLAAKHPDRVEKLAAKWETWARRAHAIPWPWKGPYRQSE